MIPLSRFEADVALASLLGRSELLPRDSYFFLSFFLSTSCLAPSEGEHDRDVSLRQGNPTITRGLDMFAYHGQLLQDKLMAQTIDNSLTDILDQLEDNTGRLKLLMETYPALLDELAETGWKCLDLEQYRQASKVFSFLLQFAPDNPGYHAAYADCCSKLKDYELASKHYEATVELAPDIPDAYLSLAEHSLILKQPESACAHLERLFSCPWFGPENPLFAEVVRVQAWSFAQIQEAQAAAL